MDEEKTKSYFKELYYSNWKIQSNSIVRIKKDLIKFTFDLISPLASLKWTFKSKIAAFCATLKSNKLISLLSRS